MTDFDPDAYLANAKTTTAFDPDAYLAQSAGSKGGFKFSDAAINTPLKQGKQVVWMKPDEYLALTPDIEKTPRQEKKSVSLQKSLDKGEEVDEIPSLDLDVGKDGSAKVIDQDGRHRALFAQQAGIDKIPVAISRSGNKGLIKSLTGMKDGSQSVPFDFQDVPMQTKPVAKTAPEPTMQAAQQKKSAQLPRWDIIGDIGRNAEQSVSAAKQDVQQALSASKTMNFGPLASAERLGNALKIPLDAAGVAASPITGTANALLGSALSYPIAPMARAMGRDPKADADAAVDQAMTLVAPEGRLIGGAVLEGDAAANALKRQNLKPGAAEAHQAGYVLPPTMATKSPNALESVASGWGGKVKLQQAASAKNQEVTTALAKKDLGVPEDIPLTEKVFKGIRDKAGQAYAAISKAVPEMRADPTFKENIAKLGTKNSQVAKDFPDVLDTKAVDDFVDRIGSVDTFSPDSALFVVRKLRSDAAKNMNAPNDPSKAALGLVQRKAADEIDDLIERNLESIPNVTTTERGTFEGAPVDKSHLVDEYRKARQLIAKSYDVEGATKGGEVSAAALAKLANKGRPLTGNLKTIADTANRFPKAVQNPAAFGGNEPYSALDAFATIGSLAAGEPSAAAAIVGRPMVRNALLSKWYQDKMMPDLSKLAASVTTPMGGNALIYSAPLPGVQNQLAKGIFRAAHIAGLRAAIGANALRALQNSQAPIGPNTQNGQQ